MSSRRAKLTEASELQLAKRWREQGDAAAARVIIEAHLGIVSSIARTLRGYGVPRDELISEGNVGLLRALEKFDQRGVRFKTYATYWVRAQMLAYILRSGSIVTSATGAVGAQFFFKLRSARARLETIWGLGDERIEPELARQFGVTVEQVRHHLVRLSTRDASLDAPVGGDESDSTLLDLVVDSRLTVEDLLDGQRREATVQRLLATVWGSLDARERAIIERRLLDREDEGITLAELGSELKLSRERLRQIEVRLKQRLRRLLEGEGVLVN